MTDPAGTAPEVEAHPEVLLFLDAKLRVQRVSDAAPPFFGLELAAMIGKRVAELFAHEPLIDVHLLFRNRPEQIQAFPARTAGQERNVALTAHPLRGASNEDAEIAHLLVVKPVTPGRPPLAQFEGVQIAPSAFVTHLSRGFAHKFNNILTVLSGYTELLGMDPAPSDIVRDSVEQFQGMNEEARKLIQFLLQIGSLIGVDPAPLQAEEMLGMAASMIARECGLTPALSLPENESVLFFCDSSRVSEILRELALNAREAGATEVQLAVEQPEAGASHGVITITDNGSGIREDPWEEIFHPFVTRHDPEERHGIGLPAARGTAVAMGGGLTLRGTEPGRTVFELWLPLVK